MKTIKISIQILLSLLLIPCIICSCLLFNASAFFQKDNISGILSELSSGNRILRYEYLSEDKDEDDFYAKLAETIPVQVALVVDISSENARICQEGAFEHIKELIFNHLSIIPLTCWQMSLRTVILRPPSTRRSSIRTPISLI